MTRDIYKQLSFSVIERTSAQGKKVYFTRVTSKESLSSLTLFEETEYQVSSENVTIEVERGHFIEGVIVCFCEEKEDDIEYTDILLTHSGSYVSDIY